jgi:hypothetical protein
LSRLDHQPRRIEVIAPKAGRVPNANGFHVRDDSLGHRVTDKRTGIPLNLRVWKSV